VWNVTGASLAFSVLPAWWQTAWFVGGAAAAFAGVIGASARWVTLRRFRRRMAELERQHALERERTRIARDMHDGLGSNLVKISMLGEMVEAGLDEPERVRREVEQIGRTARAAVRDMDEIVWAVNPKNDTVENLASYLCHFAREHFEFAPNRLHLDVPASLPSHALSAEARHNLFLAVKEALNNTLKHAQAKDVWLRLRVEEARLEISVEDNGRGLPATAADSTRSGMANLRSRSAQVGAEFELASRPGEGTRIVFRLDLE
jgi:signal transduction histidine kinase